MQKADAAVFVTFCTAGRLALPEQTRDLVLEHCLRESGIQSFAGEGARATRVWELLFAQGKLRSSPA